MKYSPVGQYALLHIMLVSNVVVILLGTIVYIIDVIGGLTRVIRGRQGLEWLIFALIIAIVGGFFCVMWLFAYSTANYASGFGLDAENFVTTLINWNDGFVILIFALFLIGDASLLKSYSLGLSHCIRDGSHHVASECEERKRFAKDAIYLVDTPVLVGSVLLLFLNNVALNDARFATVGPEAYKYFIHSGAHLKSAEALSKIMPTVFVGGFSLGSMICQLAYSQIVFTVIILRNGGLKLAPWDSVKTLLSINKKTPSVV